MKQGLAFFFFLFVACYAQAQVSFGLKWKAEKDTVLLGEPFSLDLLLPEPKPTASMVWPELTDSLGPFELLQVNWLDSAQLRFGLRLKVVGYDSGTAQIPEITLGFLNGADTLNVRILSSPIEILAPDVNLQADFQDILANPDPGYHWHEFLPWIALLVALAFLAWLVWFVFKKRKPAKPMPAAPKIDPFDFAIAALLQLKAEQANMSEEQIKEFYTRTVDVLRQMVNQVYKLDVSEMTSSEWLALWKRRPEEENTGRELKYVLHIADLVKFAKQQPGHAEHQQLIDAALAFVEACRAHFKPLTSNSNE